MPPSHTVQVLLLDLDETLYPRGNGVLRRIDRRINSFMIERLGIAPEEVDGERLRLRDRFGTTMRGLVERYELDTDEYLRHCHGVDLSDLLRPDPRLRALLRRLPVRKAVLTNAPRAHADQVLRLLGVADLLEQVIALEDLRYSPKPAADAYAAALDRLAVPAEACMFVDDVLTFVRAAIAHGMRGVWMAPTGAADAGAHHVIDDLHALEPLLAGREPRPGSAPLPVARLRER
jgi:putative hydrolase of the HAD superfamily